MVAPKRNLDMDVLRTFVAGLDLGNFARAAEQLGRSPSAVSLQLRKLEDQIGQPLLRKQGRGLVLTEAGERLASYARRILVLNDEACLALGALTRFEGWVRVGVPQDFAETWLPDLLAGFERAHPRVRIEARADRGSAMADAVAVGDLDLALTWGRLGRSESEIVGQRGLLWIGNDQFRRDPDAPLPLVLLETPCAFRAAAIAALDRAGIAWRASFATTSLAGVWAAVRAGLGVTLRTSDALPAPLRTLTPEDHGLPLPGTLDLALHRPVSPSSDAVSGFCDLLIEAARKGS